MHIQSYIHTTCEYFKRADSFGFSKQRYRSPSMTYYFVHVGVSGIPDVVHHGSREDVSSILLSIVKGMNSSITLCPQ